MPIHTWPSWGDPTSGWYWDLVLTSLWPVANLKVVQSTCDTTWSPKEHVASLVRHDVMVQPAPGSRQRAWRRQAASSGKMPAETVASKWLQDLQGWYQLQNLQNYPLWDINLRSAMSTDQLRACICGADKAARIRPSIATMTFFFKQAVTTIKR